MLPGDPSAESDLEDLLVRSRPAPDARFVAQTERRLLGDRPRARRGHRSLLAALGLSASLALAVVVATLFGGGPLASHGTGDARAKPRCEQVRVTRMERRGELVQGPTGQPTVVYAERPVTRVVRRCR